jgi:hypothetical protein
VHQVGSPESRRSSPPLFAQALVDVCQADEPEAARRKMHSGEERLAELHWYEAHGIGRKEVKRKRYLN